MEIRPHFHRLTAPSYSMPINDLVTVHCIGRCKERSITRPKLISIKASTFTGNRVLAAGTYTAAYMELMTRGIRERLLEKPLIRQRCDKANHSPFTRQLHPCL
ncbi:hypothetical protein ACN38_g3333 [Penicillium nordicum]|uniref:Uncharacterized protein n=1 Tax=Penicillium nordicum TaxID=229535 RepID=A0A0M9WI54_9EURO|nr:hypothetical protein ACN38_g3333 [Penicillium nordicum]